jgi:hypothetical protein
MESPFSGDLWIYYRNGELRLMKTETFLGILPGKNIRNGLTPPSN